MRRGWMAVFLIGLASVACAQQPGYQVAFVEPPEAVVEGEAFVVRLRYRTPAEAQPARLRLELKNPGAVVLTGAEALVGGEGIQELVVKAPLAVEERSILLAAWMGDDWRRSLCPIVHTAPIRILTRSEARRLQAMEKQAQELKQRFAGRRAALGHVGLFQMETQDWPADLADDLARRLREAGCGVSRLDVEAVCNPFVLQRDVFDLVILCDARVLPAPAIEAVARYANQGGQLIALGGPLFERTLWSYQGKWWERDGLRRAVAESLDAHVLFDFETGTHGEWGRGSNDAQSPATVERAVGGARGSGGALQVTIEHFTGWDTFTAPHLEQPFAAGHTWTTFWAKGGERTSQLAIEWREQDGSRWIAVVPLEPEWRPYALPPQAFKYWHDSPTPNRGGPGDGFHPERAARVTFGLALTHTAGLPSGPHQFWLDDIGTAPPPAELEDIDVLLWEASALPRIETLSPGYKLYPVTSLKRLRASPAQVLLSPAEIPTPTSTLAPHPRPQGTGIHKDRRWRYLPLLECLDEEGKVCGAAASLVIQGKTPQQGGVIAGVPVGDPAFFEAGSVRRMVVELARRMLDGLFLYEGGAQYYASFGGEEMPAGAVVTNRGRETRFASVRVVVEQKGAKVWERLFPLTIPAGQSRAVESPWPIPAGVSSPYTVTVTLEETERVVDRLQHQVRVWTPKAQPVFMTARQGDFFLGGKKWYAHGVNYMPSSGIGIEDGEYFEFWLDPQPYDPDVIERDLSDCQAIGFNMVSVFIYHRSLESRNLLDLLMRCEDHGLKVNLSLRPGTPMDFRWEEMRALVEKHRLAQNDTVFAYDLAWEPAWWNHQNRKTYDREWEKWIIATYGNLQAAEREWGHPVPVEEGQITNPSDEQVSRDGPWHSLVLAYRRFLNELLHERYGRARELMLTVDPHHLVSFRMTIAGDPTAHPSSMAYDFKGLANAVDIWEPEGYGRIGDWERVKPGWFTAAYARAMNPNLPVMWAEFGFSVWDQTRMRAGQGPLNFQARFYHDFYTMAHRSGANGTVCWWFPGGYRCGERSDYGILNPDRSWRPVTQVIHDWAPRMTEPRPLPQPDVWLEFDRSKYVDGLFGIYQDLQETFWQAIEEGRTPGLREVNP